jgi:hypothetical protein
VWGGPKHGREWQVSTSGLSAAFEYWPDVFANVSAERKAQVRDGLRTVRPVLVSGYECMIMVRASVHWQRAPQLQHCPEPVTTSTACTTRQDAACKNLHAHWTSASVLLTLADGASPGCQGALPRC